MTLSSTGHVLGMWAVKPTYIQADETHGTTMKHRHGYNEADFENNEDDFSLLDEEDELENLGLLEDPESSLDEENVEISLGVDADGNEIFLAEDGKVPDNHSQGYSAEEAIEGLEQRRREFREMLRKSKTGEFMDDEPEEIPAPADPAGGDGVNISMEIDEDGNERWYAADPKVPGSASMGLSAEEAVDGLEDRRSEFREMLRKSREKSKKKHSKE